MFIVKREKENNSLFHTHPRLKTLFIPCKEKDMAEGATRRTVGNAIDTPRGKRLERKHTQLGKSKCVGVTEIQQKKKKSVGKQSSKVPSLSTKEISLNTSNTTPSSSGSTLVASALKTPTKSPSPYNRITHEKLVMKLIVARQEVRDQPIEQGPTQMEGLTKWTAITTEDATV